MKNTKLKERNRRKFGATSSSQDGFYIRNGRERSMGGSVKIIAHYTLVGNGRVNEEDETPRNVDRR